MHRYFAVVISVLLFSNQTNHDLFTVKNTAHKYNNVSRLANTHINIILNIIHAL